VQPLTEARIRASFINCTKGEATRLNVPRDLATRPWDDLDYLGWRDPQAPARGYLVAEVDGRLTGIVLRAPESTAGHARKSLCSLCLTVHSGGVALMVAPRAGKSGQRGNSVGTYICSDLACSLYLRGKRDTGTTGMHETLTVGQRADRLRDNLGAFVVRVRSEPR
jgi:FBP C-terminal treble-clef zinc-finger